MDTIIDQAMTSEHSAETVRHLPIFVYGTLKPGESNYAAYLEGCCVATRPATMPHAALFSDGTYPYLMTDSRAVRPEDTAYGVLVEIASEQFAQTLERLDWLEDYKPNSPWSMYERVVGIAYTDDGPVQAWTYVGGPQSLAAIRAGRLVYIPGGTWSGRD
jgi:gamma-glutamylcyclotransferase (GGCT)/AIG2-like uncharacterized protein YtfP